jgi:hypothetical protein
MNAIITPSCLQKYVMWNKVRELKSRGFNNSQISRDLGLYRGTVAHYLSMSESEYLCSDSYRRCYSHKLDSYESYIHDELSAHPYLSSSQIHDHLKEHYPSFPSVNPKTVYNYVLHVRQKYDLPKNPEHEYRPYEKLPETPFGHYGQVDFGERYMSTSCGGHVKVYFFAMVLSRSRAKFLYFSLSPFTTALTVYAHELAFQFYGGVPLKILYDQDKVLLHNENLGDLVLTHGFRKFVSEIGFETVFCRKSDPESKGKIENVVKYVKYNFLRGRTFSNIDTLNEEASSWLVRTGNGCVHATTKLVPSEVFKEEKSYLNLYHGTPTPVQVEMKAYYVRKDNTINYKGNYYTLPTGTYQGHNTQAYVHLNGTDVHLFDKQTGKTLAVHPVCLDKGKLVRNTSHSRDNTASLQSLEDKVKNNLGAGSLIDEYLNKLHQDKSRYYRDNLTFIDRHLCAFSLEIMHKAFSLCLEKGIYNAGILIDVAKSLQKQAGQTPVEPVVTSQPHTLATSNMIPEKTDINVFNAIFQ